MDRNKITRKNVIFVGKIDDTKIPSIFLLRDLDFYVLRFFRLYTIATSTNCQSCKKGIYFPIKKFEKNIVSYGVETQLDVNVLKEFFYMYDEDDFIYVKLIKEENNREDASLHREDASLHREDASLHREDASLHREDVKSSEDASLHREDASLHREDSEFAPEDVESSIEPESIDAEKSSLIESLNKEAKVDSILKYGSDEELIKKLLIFSCHVKNNTAIPEEIVIPENFSCDIFKYTCLMRNCKSADIEHRRRSDRFKMIADKKDSKYPIDSEDETSNEPYDEEEDNDYIDIIATAVPDPREDNIFPDFCNIVNDIMVLHKIPQKDICPSHSEPEVKFDEDIIRPSSYEEIKIATGWDHEVTKFIALRYDNVDKYFKHVADNFLKHRHSFKFYNICQQDCYPDLIKKVIEESLNSGTNVCLVGLDDRYLDFVVSMGCAIINLENNCAHDIINPCEPINPGLLTGDIISDVNKGDVETVKINFPSSVVKLSKMLNILVKNMGFKNVLSDSVLVTEGDEHDDLAEKVIKSIKDSGKELEPVTVISI